MARASNAGTKPEECARSFSKGRYALIRYACAVACTVLATLVRAALIPVLPHQWAFELFLFSIAAATWYGGVGPGLLSAALGLLAAEWFFVGPSETWPSITTPHLVRIGIYLLTASALVVVSRALHKARINATLLQLAHDAILVTDQDGKISFWNKGAEVCYGWRSEEAVGRNCYELLKTVFPMPLDEIMAATRNRGEWAGELTHTARDGRIVIEARRCSLLREWPGRSGAMLMIGRDVTAQKRTEESRRNAERIYRSIGESLDYGVWVCDPDGRNTYASESFLKLVGMTQEQCSSFGWKDVLHPDDADRTIAAWKGCVRSEGKWDIMHRFRGVDGQWHPTLARGSPVRDDQGRIVCWAGINLDVGALKRTEESLRESETRERERAAQLQALMDAAPAAIFVTQDPECRSMTGNHLAYNLVGAPVGSNLSKSAPEGEKPSYRLLRNGADVAPDEMPMQRATFTGQPVRNCEITLVTETGRQLNLFGDAVPLSGEGGALLGAVGVFVDISDRNRAEAALRESNFKLVQLSRDLLRTQDYERRRIARELHDGTSQLLAVLNMSLSRLCDPTIDVDRKRQALAEAIQLADACSTEIRTVTYLLHPPLLDQVGLVGALSSYTQGFSRRTGVEVEVKISSSFGRLDRDRESALFRIVQEGLANIHKHSGSQLAVIRLDRDAREARLVLRDRGRGLPPALRQGRGFVGFGVGILGMRERAEQLGGSLDLTSDDTGTTIAVTLPLVQSNEENEDSSRR